MNKANVYIVLVNVRYSKEGFEPAHRQFVVRVLAFTEDSANSVAMEWAQQQKPDGIMEGVSKFANHAETVGTITPVDCIASSVIEGR